jgi:hypothetical protein
MKGHITEKSGSWYVVRDLASQVIERAQTEMAFVDRGCTGKRIVTLQGEEVEIGPNEEDDYATRTNYNLSEAARKPFRRGK